METSHFPTTFVLIRSILGPRLLQLLRLSSLFGTICDAGHNFLRACRHCPVHPLPLSSSYYDLAPSVLLVLHACSSLHPAADRTAAEPPQEYYHSSPKFVRSPALLPLCHYGSVRPPPIPTTPRFTTNTTGSMTSAYTTTTLTNITTLQSGRGALFKAFCSLFYSANSPGSDHKIFGDNVKEDKWLTSRTIGSWSKAICL
ncbi:hypothetical protein BDQ17DRAFT_34618 [Cyathus striatus]|nr:hypothetical protein BDQ17DRAFT_34618 [Cyathus striatus]